MCWNKEVSIKTFLFSLIVALSALKTNTATAPYIAFYLLFSTMQLVEYFLWSNLKNPVENAFWSKVGLLIIVLQPIVFSFIIEDTPIQNKMILAYIAFLLLSFTIIKPLNTVEFSSTRAPNGHLKWNWIQPWYIFVVVALFIILPLLLNKEWKFFGIALAVLIGIIYTYIESGTWGSMWCWISNFAGIGLILKMLKVE